MAINLRNNVTWTGLNLVTNPILKSSATNPVNIWVKTPVNQYKTEDPRYSNKTQVNTQVKTTKPMTPVNQTQVQTPVNNNQSRFIWFQNNFWVQNQFTQQAKNVINWNTAQQNIKKAWERKVFPVYTQKQQVADYNKIQDYKYRTREEAIKDFHYDVRNTNGQLTAEDIAEKYPEFKNNVQDALKLQEALLPYVRDDEFAPMKAITENFPNLLPAKQQKTYDDSQNKKFDERINYMKNNTNYEALSDYWKVFYDNMMALNDVAERVRKNYKVWDDVSNLDIIMTAIENKPNDWVSSQRNIYKEIYDDMIMAGKKLDNSDLRQLSKWNLKRWLTNPLMEYQAELSKWLALWNRKWNEYIREPLDKIAEEAKESVRNSKSLSDFNKKYLEKAIDATNAIVNIPWSAFSWADRALTNKIQLSNWNDTKSFWKNISEKLENITKIWWWAIETFFNTVASPVTAWFHAIWATPYAWDTLNAIFESVPNAVDFYMSGKWRQTLSDITLWDEWTRIWDLLWVKWDVASSIISDWYNNELDDQGRADFQNSVFMLLWGAKWKTKWKTPTFDKMLTNGKINAWAIADWIIDTIKQWKNRTSFSLFLKKKMLENDRTQMLPDRPWKVNDNVWYTEYKWWQLRGQDYLDAVTEWVWFAKNRFIENFKEWWNVDKAIEQRKAYETNKETIQNWKKAWSPTIKEWQTKVWPVREEWTEITEYTGEYWEPEVKAPEKWVVEKVKEWVKTTVENINNTVKNSFSNLIKRKSWNQEQQWQQWFSKSWVTDNWLNQSNFSQKNEQINTKKLNTAQTQLIQNYNRMNPKAIDTFEEKFWENYWQYMYERWFTKAWEDNLKDMVNYQKDLMDIKENALNQIEWRFKDQAITDMLDHLLEYYENTKNRKMLAEFSPLKEQLERDWLTMAEANKIRKKYQYDIRTKFYSDWNSEKIELANNIYLAMKDFLDKTAKENWLDSLDEINREIMKVQHIIWWVSYKLRWSSANNTLWLTDYITLASMLNNPAWLAVFLWKQALKTNWVRNFILDKAVGWKWNAKNRITADKMWWEIERIAKINDEKARNKALEKFYNTYIKPVKELSEYFDNSIAEFKKQFNEMVEEWTLDNALPDLRESDVKSGKKNLVTSKNQVTIEADEKGNARRKGQISEVDKRNEDNKKGWYVKSEPEQKNIVTAKPKEEVKTKEEPKKTEVNDDAKKYLYDKNWKQKNVYHYSDTDFKEFDLDKQNNKLWIYFSPSSKPTSKLRKYKITATIDMNKPLVISPKNKSSQIYPELKELLSDELENQYDTKFRELLLRDWYDGVIMLDDKWVVSQYVVLNPEQINVKKQWAIQPQTKNEVTKKKPEKKTEVEAKEEPKNELTATTKRLPREDQSRYELLMNDLEDLWVKLEDENWVQTPERDLAEKFKDYVASENPKITKWKDEYSSKNIAQAVKEYVDTHNIDDFYKRNILRTEEEWLLVYKTEISDSALSDILNRIIELETWTKWNKNVIQVWWDLSKVWNKNEITSKKTAKKTEKSLGTNQVKENSDLKDVVWDKYYEFLERQVEIINDSNKKAESPKLKEPITVDDLDLTSQFYQKQFDKIYQQERNAILNEINKYPITKLDSKLTDKQIKILDKTESEEEKQALYTKWREERMKEWDMSDEDIAKVEGIMQRFNKLSERRENFYNYTLEQLEKKKANEKVINTKNAVTSKKQETATEFMDRLERENAEDIKAQQSDLFNMPETEDIEAIDNELTARQQEDLKNMPETEDIEAMDKPKNLVTNPPKEESKIDKILKESEWQELKVIKSQNNNLVLFKVNWEDRAYSLTDEQLKELNEKKGNKVEEKVEEKSAEPAQEKPKNLVTGKTKQETVVEKIIRESDWAELKYDEDINWDNKTISFTANWKDYKYSVTNSDLKELWNKWRLSNWYEEEKNTLQAKRDSELNQTERVFWEAPERDIQAQEIWDNTIDNLKKNGKLESRWALGKMKVYRKENPNWSTISYFEWNGIKWVTKYHFIIVSSPEAWQHNYTIEKIWDEPVRISERWRTLTNEEVSKLNGILKWETWDVKVKDMKINESEVDKKDPVTAFIDTNENTKNNAELKADYQNKLSEETQWEDYNTGIKYRWTKAERVQQIIDSTKLSNWVQIPLRFKKDNYWNTVSWGDRQTAIESRNLDDVEFEYAKFLYDNPNIRSNKSLKADWLKEAIKKGNQIHEKVVEEEQAKAWWIPLNSEKFIWQKPTYKEWVDAVYDQVKAISDFFEASDKYKHQASYDQLKQLSQLRQEAGRATWQRLKFKSDRSTQFKEFMKNVREAYWDEKKLRAIANTLYIEKVRKDIKDNYAYPEEVTNSVPWLRTAQDNFKRYLKGRDTSFSWKDPRIDYSEKDVIWAWVKRQDWKQITADQKREIKNSILEYSKIMWVDMKKMAEDVWLTYVHLNWKHPFLTRFLWVFHSWFKSISVWAREESYREWRWEDTQVWTNPVVMAHEITHAIDWMFEWSLFSDDITRRMDKLMNNSKNLGDYWHRKEEITARMVEEYVDIMKWWKWYYKLWWYWDKDVFEREVKPYVEQIFKEKFDWYRLSQKERDDIKLEEKPKSMNSITSNWLNKITSK